MSVLLRPAATWLAAALLLLGSTTPGWSSDSANEGKQPLPNGWGGVQFRMSVAEAQALYPDLTLLGDSGDMLRDGVVTIPRLQEYHLENQAAFGTDGCEVILKFAADQLYFADIRCPTLGDAGPMLRETYGDPTRFFIDADYWYADHAVISHRRGSYMVGFIDRELEQLVQTSIKQEVMHRMAAELKERGITTAEQLTEETLKQIHPRYKAAAEAEAAQQAAE